jgi:hypothetical protein
VRDLDRLVDVLRRLEIVFTTSNFSSGWPLTLMMAME